MASQAELILAVAGSRKTQGIVEECASAPVDSRILILTYTTNNQNELNSRTAAYAGDHHGIEIQGWFAFLIKQIVRPFLPFVFPGHRLRGFDFYAPPQKFQATTKSTRYLSPEGKVYRVHLPQLAFSVHEKSGGCWLDRLTRLYDIIYIDEVQDLCGYDLEILKLLIESGIKVKMVGDIRQAVIATNPQEAKNKKYMHTGIWDWFRELEEKKKLIITQRCETWRCRQEIADFADKLFGPEWGFDSTISRNSRSSGHDGVFIVLKRNLHSYVEHFNPLILRYSSSSWKGLPFNSMNYKESKGLSVERVCILPTDAIKKFLVTAGPLSTQQSTELYVATTRAAQSVAFVVDDPVNCKLPVWGA